MAAREFRFGVVAAATDAARWTASARMAADLGYDILLSPDGMSLLAPLPALASAAALAPLRVGTFVMAAPLRPPGTIAWEAHSMTVLTGGRFELGIGTGLPIAAEQARGLGLPGGTTAQRLEQVREAVRRLREADGDLHTPVMIAAGGPRSLGVAAEQADIVALALGTTAGPADAARLVDELRDLAGERAERIELSLNLFVVGDTVPEQLRRFVSLDVPELAARGALTLLRGSPRQMADELQRRRDLLGVSYVTVNGAFIEPFAPVIELLAGD
jgi:alkanesulfonate monooxygenase SsuD/methylene tetrahydromethanopterin reductase-like flavin-dependent oxidoreductase (luciferase family)